MAFRLLEDEGPSAGLARIAAEEVDTALRGVDVATPEEPFAGVHDARRSLKRVRAVLRLVRPRIGEPTYRRENRVYRDAGRALAPVREAEVLVTTVSTLLEETGGRAPELLERLRRRRDEIGRRNLSESRRRALARRLRDARARIERWSPAVVDWEALEGGLLRSYAAGRRALRRARASADDAGHHHEWRKRAKDHRHHVEILQGAWPPVLEALADELHRLSDLLGDANDLQLAIDALGDDMEGSPGGGQVAALKEAARSARDRCWEDAWPLGERIWAEPPAVFGRRLERYWESWKGCPSTPRGEDTRPGGR